MIDELVTETVALLPKAKDGISPDPAQISAQIDAAVAKAVEAIPKPKDGRSVDPEAVHSMIRAEIERAVAMIPTPKDGDPGERGKDGTNGVDGFKLEQLGAELRDDRVIAFTFRSENREEVREIRLPIPVDRGPYSSTEKYEKGDGVTYGGSWFIAKRDEPTGAPGSSPDWRLAVKRGKDAA